MTFLQEDNALFLGPNWRLTAMQGGDGTELCVFDFPVAAFAVSNSAGLIAMLFKPEEGSKELRDKKKRNEKAPYLLKVFGFDASEVEIRDLRATIEIREARQLAWSPSAEFLVAFDPPSGDVTFVKCECAGGATALTTLAADNSACPHFFHNNWCGLLSLRRQTIDYWDLTANKVADTLQLSRRNVRVVDTAAVGRMNVTLYDDMSISFAFRCCAEKKFVKLPKMDGLFPVEENNKVGKMAAKLRTASINETVMLVGLSSSRHVYRFLATESSATLVGHSVVELGDSILALTLHEGGETAHSLVECGRLQFARRPLRFQQKEEAPKKEKKERKAKSSEASGAALPSQVDSPDSPAVTSAQSAANCASVRPKVVTPVAPQSSSRAGNQPSGNRSNFVVIASAAAAVIVGVWLLRRQH